MVIEKKLPLRGSLITAPRKLTTFVCLRKYFAVFNSVNSSVVPYSERISINIKEN